MSWDDAPSHICRGGDKRGLAFCCPPVKPCPIMFALEEVNLTPQEYIDIKNKFAKETRLGEGPGTCFGSLVWCCKPSKPCPLRDMTLRNINMTPDEYLDLKKQLSEALVGEEGSTLDENAIALSQNFDISKTEALKVLEDCNNDLRKAVKLLKVKSLEDSD
ncbi:MAG: methanogenesis marker 9 domain-containing protein [Methanobrevibacter sp.]|uniref:methanogenesis marker 9 domain-containing protein n=1 Tax=Methanobrevibacter sp. TaxID=66852 RepID=UPI0026DF707A|nr:methanogenesis marker 9 domain-containing protein [Methanobrevibacter sp.]MDO5848206.1 methanogenesis marker 9 domain-containing protein [Methanobrevibacter sp.]